MILIICHKYTRTILHLLFYTKLLYWTVAFQYYSLFRGVECSTEW